jgi:flagellar motor switch protein FliM
LIAELLGLPNDAELVDRPATDLEQDLCAMFFEYMTLSLADNFPGSAPIPGRLKETVDNPKRVRLFRASDVVTTVKLAINLPRGKVIIQWILPKEGTVAMMDGIVDRRAKLKPNHQSGNPKEVVEKMQLEIVGILGEMTLSLNQLAKMKEGDVFVLNQKIDQPLVAKIDGKPFYECWPGKLGSVQGLEIRSCL